MISIHHYFVIAGVDTEGATVQVQDSNVDGSGDVDGCCEHERDRS